MPDLAPSRAPSRDCNRPVRFILISKNTCTIIALLSSIFLAGCLEEVFGEHESFTDINGKTFVINKRNGDIYQLLDGNLAQVPRLSLADIAPRSLGRILITKDDLIQTSLSVKFDSNQLLYRLEIKPDNPLEEDRMERWRRIMAQAIHNNGLDTFHIFLQDSQDFRITEPIPVMLRELREQQNSEGTWAYYHVGKQPSELSEYLQIKSWSISYPWSVDEGRQ